jgi:hypothetical protein
MPLLGFPGATISIERIVLLNGLPARGTDKNPRAGCIVLYPIQGGFWALTEVAGFLTGLSHG